MLIHLVISEPLFLRYYPVFYFDGTEARPLEASDCIPGQQKKWHQEKDKAVDFRKQLDGCILFVTKSYCYRQQRFYCRMIEMRLSWQNWIALSQILFLQQLSCKIFFLLKSNLQKVILLRKLINTHDMSMGKLLQFSISNYGLLLYFSIIWIWHF